MNCSVLLSRGQARVFWRPGPNRFCKFGVGQSRMRKEGISMVDKQGIPTSPELMWPTLLALRALGGSGRIDEINEEVIHEQGITEEQLAFKRSDDHHLTLVEYRLAWSRTNLKNAGAIDNSSSGVWALTDGGRNWTEEELNDHWQVWKTTYGMDRRSHKVTASSEGASVDGQDSDELDSDWKVSLLDRLLEMEPSAFERLAQRLLREAGFRNVEVVGKTGDGGIDGVGVYQLSLVSFPIYFQCKRYRGSVSSGAVRDFRGAMAGRGEKGLLITTGAFTRDARDEATRDGAPPVELVSGDNLCDLLKEYSLGTRTETRTIEKVTVVPEFFDQF
jgi:restriction system protein